MIVTFQVKSNLLKLVCEAENSQDLVHLEKIKQVVKEKLEMILNPDKNK